MSIEREKSATPTMERHLSEQFNNVLNKSFSVCGHSDDENDLYEDVAVPKAKGVYSL